MKTIRFTDPWRSGYRTAQQSREPGYLARRFEEIRKIQLEEKVKRANTAAIRRISSKR